MTERWRQRKGTLKECGNRHKLVVKRGTKESIKTMSTKKINRQKTKAVGDGGLDSKKKTNRTYTAKVKSVRRRKKITININPQNNVSNASSPMHESPKDANGPVGPRRCRSSTSNLSVRTYGELRHRDTSARSSRPHRTQEKPAILCHYSTRTSSAAGDSEEDWQVLCDSMIRIRYR